MVKKGKQNLTIKLFDLFNKYHPIETDISMSREEKSPFMEKWWKDVNDLQLKHLDKGLIDIALKEQNIDEFYQDVMDKVYEYADMCSN